MKLCKNHFDIIIKPVPRCIQCAFRRSTRPCFWVKLIIPNTTKVTLDCGGVRTTSLSDIFKL